MNLPLSFPRFAIFVQFFCLVTCNSCDIKKLQTAIARDDTDIVKEFLDGEYRERVLRELLIDAELNEPSGLIEPLVRREDLLTRHGALHWAVIKKAPNVARLLLKNGADVNILNLKGVTPLFLASKQYVSLFSSHDKYLHEEVVKTLLEFEVDVQLRNESGLTPLLCATERCNLSLVAKLKARGGNINDRCGMGKTSIHRAVGRGYVEMTEFLLKNGAEADATDNYGKNALHIIFNTSPLLCARGGIDQAAIAKLILGTKNAKNMLEQRENRQLKTPVDIFFEQSNPNREILTDLLKILPSLDDAYAVKALRTFSRTLEQHSSTWPLDNFPEYVKIAFNSYLEILSKEAPHLNSSTALFSGKTGDEYPSPKNHIKYFMENGLYSLYVILQTHFQIHRRGDRAEAAKDVDKFDTYLHKISEPFQNVLWNAIIKGTPFEILPNEVSTTILQDSTYVPFIQRLSKIMSLVQFTWSLPAEGMVDAVPAFVNNIEQRDILLF